MTLSQCKVGDKGTLFKNQIHYFFSIISKHKMSLILLNMKKEQLHRMVLSTFLLKMSLIYVALYLSISGHYFKEKGSEYVR